MMLLLADIWMPDAESMRLIAPDLALLGTIVAILLATLALGRRQTSTALGIALLGAISAGVLAWSTLESLSDRGVELFAPTGSPAFDQPASPGVLVADRLAMSFRVLLMCFLVAILGMWALFDARREQHANEFLVLLLSSALGMMLMTSCVNLLVMIIAIELVSQPSYALAGFDRTRRTAAEAAVKYVLFGASTTGLMVFGASLLYGLFGTLHVPTLAAHAAANCQPQHAPLLGFALLALFAGIGFKISAVPFHFWCPDVFQGASLPVATWLSVASKAAGVVLLIRLVQIAAQPTAESYATIVLPILHHGIAFFGVITCTVANLAAYGQTNVRRLLAYSSIAHAGYMLCAGAIAVREPELSAAAASAIMAYLMVYAFMNFGAFLALGLVADDSGSEELHAFTGLGWRDPLTAMSLTLCLLSLIGLPPLGGFIVKWWLIYALGSAAHATPLLWIVAGAVVVNTAVSLYYYVRVIRQMYLSGVGATGSLETAWSGKLALHACAVVLVLTGTVAAGPLKRVADGAAARMYAAAPMYAAARVYAQAPTYGAAAIARRANHFGSPFRRGMRDRLDLLRVEALDCDIEGDLNSEASAAPVTR
jgi:NADH-quinone oxidoreductase subunit N